MIVVESIVNPVRMLSGNGLPAPTSAVHVNRVQPTNVHPNILLVIADDHRADAIRALGHSTVLTPVLDSLVRSGTAFTRVNIAGSLMPAVCAPSRACLLTGRGIFQADAAPALLRGPHYEVQIPATACTLPERFRAAGYQTFFTGKWHNDLPALLRSFEAGEEIFHGGMCEHTAVPVRNLEEIRRGAPTRTGEGFSSEIFCAAAETFIRTRLPERPFFTCIAFTSPHDPRTPPAEYRASYEPAKIPLPSNFQPAHAFDNGELEIRDELLAPRPLSGKVVREHLADYYGMISHHDACLGRVFDALRDTGQAANTLVVYVSDHGLALGSHGLLGKQNLYEHSVRVPLIIAGPGVPAGERRAELAYAFDLFATLCDLAKVPVPEGIDSQSLVPVLAGTGQGRETLCAAYMDCQRMATDGRWKLIRYLVAGQERLQLFDLSSDPDERQDLASDPASRPIINRLLGTLRDWQETVRDQWMRTALEESAPQQA